VVWIAEARLRVMMRHPLMKLASDNRFVGHRLIIVQLPEGLLFDALRYQTVKAHERFGFLALTLPVFARLQAECFK